MALSFYLKSIDIIRNTITKFTRLLIYLNVGKRKYNY